MVKTILRKKKKSNNNNNNKPKQKSNHRLQQVADYQRGDHLKEGTQIFILLSVQRKVWKKMKLHTSTKTAHHGLCWCCFTQKFFIWCLNRPTCTTSNTQTDNLDVAANCLALRCQTWSLSLTWLCRWDTNWKTHYMTTGRDSDSYTIHFTARPWHETDFYTYCVSAFADNSQRPDEGEEYDRLWKLRSLWYTEWGLC